MGLSNDLSCESGSLLLPPQPPWAFSIRGLRLYFPALEPWVAQSASLPAVCLVYLCTNVGPWGATHCSACPVLRHSESGPLGLSVCECGATGSASGLTACPFGPTLRQSWSRQGNWSPLPPPPPACPSPPLLLVWMNVYFLFPWCGLLCCSIFCQFWLCEEVQCAYLRRHLGSLSGKKFF